MENSNPKFVPDSELNKDLYLSLFRNIKVSYHLDFIGFFTHDKNEKTPHSKEIMEFLYRRKKEAKNTIENTKFNKESYELTRLAYMRCYEKILEDMSKVEPVPSSVYKVKTLIQAVVSIQFAYTAFKNEDYYIGVWFYEGYNSYTFQIKWFNGFNPKEVEAKGWRRSERGSNIKQEKNIILGKEVARDIIKEDKKNILKGSDFAEIVQETLTYMFRDDGKRKDTIPSIRQIQESWLKDIIPNYARKRGRANREITEKKTSLKQEITNKFKEKYHVTQ